MWILATAIVGVGVPITFSVSEKLATEPLDWQIYAAFISYLVVTLLAFITYFPKQEINLVNRPDVVRWQLWEIPEPRFYREMLLHIENAWGENARVLTVKAWSIRLAMAATTTELLFSLWWLWLLHRGVVG
jgi:hypothetical protein